MRAVQIPSSAGRLQMLQTDLQMASLHRKRERIGHCQAGYKDKAAVGRAGLLCVCLQCVGAGPAGTK